MTYGAKIHFNTTDRSTNVTSGYPGRQYIYLKGDWGSMEFGNWIGADSGLNICPLACTYKGFGGLDTPYHSYVQKPKGNISHHINPFWFNQSPKATYYTPVVNGFQAGVSYTPTENAPFFSQTLDPTHPDASTKDGTQKDIVGLGAQWNGDFGGTTVGLSAVGAISDGATEMNGVKRLLTDLGVNPMDAEELQRQAAIYGYDTTDLPLQIEGLGYYELTGKVGFGGFVFAGTWWDFGDGNAPKELDQDYTGWAVDASYAFGPYGLEVQYAHAEKSWDFGSLGTIMSSDFDGWNVSLGYSIAPGLKWYGEVTRGSWDVMGTASPAGEYSGTAFISGLYLNF